MKDGCSLAYLSRNPLEDFIIFNQTVQVHDTRLIHSKVGQKLIIRHVRTILQHPFLTAIPVPVRSS